MAAYYNEIDPEAVATLRQCIDGGLIAPGVVDSRSIKEVRSHELKSYTQCHFFAGAGLWSVAARFAGWPDDRPLWTASCPCQPISVAGKHLGADDPRHLWPDLYHIVRSARAAGHGPAVLMGEQVAGKAGYDWFDGVRSDLAAENIAARTVDIPACAVDAPHQRNRLWWVAVADTEISKRGSGLCEIGSEQDRTIAANGDGRHIILGDAIGSRLEGFGRHVCGPCGRSLADRSVAETDGGIKSWWSDASWIECHGEKIRRAKPGIRMLVDGMAGRAGLWRLAGNSIVPQLAAEVIRAFIEVEE